MNTSELSQHPLLVLRLHGSQAEMGAAQGRLLRAVGGYERAAPFYSTMAARMMVLSLPYKVRPIAEALFRRVLARLARSMDAQRRRMFPAYAARTDALLAAGGYDIRTSANLMSMEVLQNGVGVLGRLGVVPPSTLTSALAACSSLSVWGERSADGTLRHARNFDFPGVGIWDEAPLVAFCSPDEGLRYGFVAMRGADVPGVTAFNEAGITLTVHTRFHRDVRFDGASIIDVGHEIVRRARTLDEAERVLRERSIASTWGILVSSAAERSARLFEVTGRQVVAHRPGDRAHLACTNHYLAPELTDGELCTARAFTMDTRARLARLESRAQDSALDARDLELVLANLCAPDARDGRPDTLRLAGDCVVSPVTVQSIVAEPEARRIRVSVGRAPASFGPYVEVPWSWDGPASSTVDPPAVAPRALNRHGQPLTDEQRAAVRAYAELARFALEGARPVVVRELCEALTLRMPQEPHFAALAGYAALSAGDLDASLAHLDRALVHEAGEYRRARLLLQKTRIARALGRSDAAETARRELLAFTGDGSRPEREAADRETKRPLSRARLARAVPDFLLADVTIPGVH